MNLIIDVGNSYVKLAIFNDHKLLAKTSCDENDLLSEYKILKKAYPQLKSGLVASVGRLPKSPLVKINKDLTLHELSYKSKLPFVNLYETPKTLGVDRMGLISAAVMHYPQKNALVIDAGTCITYDFVNNKGEYLGGAISPGLRLRYKALNNLTQNLPLLETEQPKAVIGKTTEASMHSGVVYGAAKEIDGIIEHYRANYRDLTVILTGGDTEILSNQLKNSIFAHSNFLLEGLNYILDYNSL